jgi:WD40 repeat protein
MEIRFLRVILFLIVFGASIFGQAASPLVKLTGRFELPNPDEKILAHRLIDNDTKLWVLGTDTIQLWDVENNKVIYSTRHGMKYLYPSAIGDISPDGTMLLMLSRPADKQKIKISAITPPDIIVTGKNKDLPYEKAAVWDMATGTRIKLFDDLTFNGYWSKNGKTLLVTSDPLREMVYNGKPFLTVGSYPLDYLETPTRGTASYQFYDAATLEKRSSITLTDIDRSFLSADGKYLYAVSNSHKNFSDVLTGDYRKAEVFAIWSTLTGRIEKHVPLGGDFQTNSWKLNSGSGGKYLAMVAKGKGKAQQIIVWEMNGSDAPKFRIDISSPVKDSQIIYSPDEKFFAIDTGDNAQIYDAETGKLKVELKNAMQPAYWLDDNRIVFDRYAKRFAALETGNGNFLYEQPLISLHRSASYGTASDGSDLTADEVVDETRILPHPGGQLFLAFSNQQAKLFGARKGELLSTIFQAPPTPVNQKKGEREKELISDGSWSTNGKRLVLVENESRAVSIWDFNQN